MSKKFAVYITYGVYVDMPDTFDITNEDTYDTLKHDAVSKMFSHGQLEVATNCEVEAEDITEEMEEYTKWLSN
jgi:hypothetical protein